MYQLTWTPHNWLWNDVLILSFFSCFTQYKKWISTDFCTVFNFICCSFAGACPHQNITDWSGTFQPSSYPLSYAPNLDCYWLIKVSDGNLIEIMFQDFAVNKRTIIELFMFLRCLVSCTSYSSIVPLTILKLFFFLFQMDGITVCIHFLYFLLFSLFVLF